MSSPARADATTVELLHWWEAGDGAAALDALLEGFHRTHPSVTVDAAQPANLSLTVKSRILDQRSPDMWVEWPGAALAPYVNAGVVRDVTDLWEREGFADAFIDGAADLARRDGAYWTVPFNIHRSNNLFYRVDLAEEYGIDFDSLDSPRALVEALAGVDGHQGLLQPMKNPWTVLQAWEGVYLGQHGVEAYTDAVEGRVERRRSEVRETFDILADLAARAPDEAVFTAMTDANEAFVAGEGVCFSQGDWVVGAYHDAAEFEYGRDWDHVPMPGTAGLYQVTMDGCLAAASADERVTDDFLAYAGSVEGQRRFTRAKGAIPARTDVSTDDFGPFLSDQASDFRDSLAQPPSIAHGLAVSAETLVALRGATSEFVERRDPETATDAFVDALRDEGR